jgi:hypothetical protein
LGEVLGERCADERMLGRMRLECFSQNGFRPKKTRRGVLDERGGFKYAR